MAKYVKKKGKNLNVSLNIGYGNKTLTKSIGKIYSEEIVQRKEISSVDTGVQVVAFNDASFLASSLKDAKALLICNEGEVSAEINMNVAAMHGTPDSNAGGGGTDIKRVLNAGEFFYLPNISLLKFDANESAGMGATLDNQAPTTDMYVDSGVNLDGALEDSETALQVADIAKFEVGDLVQVGINDTTIHE